MRRTTATTDYLKECMGTALLELMKEKPIEKISIEEMTAKADVGRSTYFRYFKSKDEFCLSKSHVCGSAFPTNTVLPTSPLVVMTASGCFLNFAFPLVLFVICSTQLIANM